MLEDIHMCPCCGSYDTHRTGIIYTCGACDNTFNQNWREELLDHEHKEQQEAA